MDANAKPEPLFTADGCLSDESLELLIDWPTPWDVKGWLEFAIKAFDAHHGRVWIEGGKDLCLATGGWSENEVVIDGMRHSHLWHVVWKSSHRGGLEVFDIDRVGDDNKTIKELIDAKSK